MQLIDMRTAVRTHLELDEDDLPNSLVDGYLREAFQRTIQREQRWPFLENDWSVSALTVGKFDMPTDLGGLAEVSYNGAVLVHISHNLATQTFGRDDTPTAGQPRYFSIWGQQIHVWPLLDVGETIRLRGWRLPTEFASPSSASSSEPDCDPRLHLTLVHYAISRVYAQQEDEVLERTHLDSWNRGVELARVDIMRSIYSDPLIMNQGMTLPTLSSRLVGLN